MTNTSRLFRIEVTLLVQVDDVEHAFAVANDVAIKASACADGVKEAGVSTGENPVELAPMIPEEIAEVDADGIRNIQTMQQVTDDWKKHVSNGTTVMSLAEWAKS